MDNTVKYLKGNLKMVSVLQRRENKKDPQTYCISTEPDTPNRYCKHPIDKPKVRFNIDQYYPSHQLSTHNFYVNNLRRKIPEKSYMDFCSENLNKNKQIITSYYCSHCANSKLIYQDWPLFKISSMSFSGHQSPNHQTIDTQKQNAKESRYMDYYKNKDHPINAGGHRSLSPDFYHEENYDTIPVYRSKRNRSTDSNENDNACYFMTDPIEPNQCYDELDRRSRLCNYIMDQTYPIDQLAPQYKEEDSKEKPLAKSRYKDFYYKKLDEYNESPTCDSTVQSYYDKDSEAKPHTKSRYTDSGKNTDERKESDTCDCCHNSKVKDNSPGTSSVYLSDDQSPLYQTNTKKPNEIKSRYMDWNKVPTSDVLKKDPVKIPQLDWKDYHRLHTIHKFLEDMQYNFPSLCTTGVIGSSLENRDLKVLKVSNSNYGNASVWIDAGIHAREWIAPAVNTYIINYIVNNFEKLPTCIQNKDWYFLPVMNPDGYEYTHTSYRMWRKNKAWHGRECVGVDLNRNFSFGWGGKGSSDDPKSPFYRGPHPFSEPESRAVRDMLKSSGIKFKVYITLHSFGEVILFPFAYRDELCPDYIRLLEGATVMSKAIHATSGTTFKVGISRDVMYGAAGTSNDWSYGEAKIPFCYLLELGSKKHKFRLPQIEIEETGREILSSIMALMDFVDNYDMNGEFIELPTGDVDSINIWKEERSTMDFFVDVPRVAQVAAMLHERGIPFSVSIRDVDALKMREQGSTITVNVSATDRPDQSDIPSPCECMNWNTYHGLRTIYAFMDKLAESYPYLCTTYPIGKTCEGRDIKVLKISNGNPDNKGVWIDGDIHAREWVSVAVVTFIANEIVQNFHKMPDCVTNKDWYILPVMNPDGYVYTHTTDRMWRKNRGKYGQCVGVDLNRNFSYGWGEAGEDGSSEDPGSIFYRGPAAFSEPETAAVKRAILESDTEFQVFLSFHSYGEVIIFPWGYTSEPCPTYVELLEGGTVMAKAIHAVNGRTYKVGSTKDIMYYSSGTSIDWSYGVAHIPYSYMIELPSKQHRFLLPKDQIIGTAAEVFSGLLELMDFVDRRSKGTSASRTSFSSKL